MWKDIIGFEGQYQVSNKGEVRSLQRYVKGARGSKRLLKARLMRISTNVHGYASASLCKDAKLKTLVVHRLVAKAFLPNPKNKPCVNHKDGNRLNNNVNNLEWVTYSENTKHAFKPNINQIKKIRKLIEQGLTNQQIVDQL